MPWQWPSGEKIVETIREKEANAAEGARRAKCWSNWGSIIQHLAS